MTRPDWDRQFAETEYERSERQRKARLRARIADPFIDPTKEGMFRDHSCWKCGDGAKPCPNGQTGPSRNCEYPHARND